MSEKSIAAKQLLVAIYALSVAVGTIILALRIELTQIFYLDRLMIIAVGTALLLYGAANLLLRYLRGDLSVAGRSIEQVISRETGGAGYAGLVSELDHSNRMIESLSRKLESIESRPINLSDLDETERETLLSNLKTQLQKVLASDLVQDIEQKYSSTIVEAGQISRIRRRIEATRARLLKEVEALSRRGNLNLVIGALTTIAAVTLLAYLVLGATISYTNLSELLSHVIPRLSIAIFIEVFSFFFLKLYKSSLQEIKYFQNELTNIEMKSVALETALLTLSSQPSNPLIDHLMRTDRNLVNSIPQSSTERIGKQLEPKDVADILDKLAKVLNLGGSK